MIYESEKMRLEGIRIIKTAGEYKCLVCKDLTSGARTAAEAQMRSTSVPVMQFPKEDASSDDFSSSGKAQTHY